MRTSWADLAASSAAENVAAGSANNCGAGTTTAPGRSAYVPPHLRNRPASSDPPAAANSGPAVGNDRSGHVGSRWGGGPRNDYNRSGYSGGSRGGSGWGEVEEVDGIVGGGS